MKKVILVDMDGVLVDLTPTWLRLYSEATGEWIHPDAITDYEFEQFVAEPDVFFGCLQGALEQSTPMPGSSKFMDLYENPDYDVYVVTYAHGAAEEGHKAKLDWMACYFPDFPADRIIFTKHKHLVKGDYLIEDSPSNCDDWSDACGGITILVDQPYNQDYNPDVRASTFAAVPGLIRGIENGSFMTKEEFYASK